ncbi:AP-4 complex subunit epsilon [Linum grandiflorum]
MCSGFDLELLLHCRWKRLESLLVQGSKDRDFSARDALQPVLKLLLGEDGHGRGPLTMSETTPVPFPPGSLGGRVIGGVTQRLMDAHWRLALAIMALPAILNSSNNLELMWKSESEVFDIIESAITVAALRWPEKLLAQKQRIFRPYHMACRYSSLKDDDDGRYNSTVCNQEITKEEEEEPTKPEVTKEEEEEPTKPEITKEEEEEPTKPEITKEEEEEPTKPRRRIIRIKLVKDGKPTTATTVGSGTGATTATTVGSGMGANLKMASDIPWSNSEEYEKKLENSKRKLKEGYSKFEDSRKRSKRWDDALRAYTVKASQASSLHLVLEATLGLVCGFIRFVRVQTREAALLVGILPQVVELLGHQKEAVRKKAIMALRRFYQKSPSSVSHLVSNFRKRLCDNDPGVMGATLCPLFDLISRDVNSFKDLVVSFVSIPKQVA